MNSPRFLYLKCPDCQWDCIFPDVGAHAATLACPLCLEDCGHTVQLRSRDALTTDKVEGFDARQGLAR